MVGDSPLLDVRNAEYKWFLGKNDAVLSKIFDFFLLLASYYWARMDIPPSRKTSDKQRPTTRVQPKVKTLSTVAKHIPCLFPSYSDLTRYFGGFGAPAMHGVFWQLSMVDEQNKRVAFGSQFGRRGLRF